MPIEISSLRNFDDLKESAKKYIKKYDNSIIPISYARVLRSLETDWKLGKLVKIAIKDGEIIGGICGDFLEIDYCPYLIYSQKHCMIYSEGYSSAIVLKLLHEELYRKGELLGAHLIYSTANFNDVNLSFVKILERFGWGRKGYLAYRRTSHYMTLVANSR